MNEDNIHVPTTPTGRDCGNTGSDVADSRKTTRRYLEHYLTRFHLANARLKLLKTSHRRCYMALRKANPIRTEARAMLVEYNRLAGREWIEHTHPFWATARCFLSDAARDRKPIVNDLEMLVFVDAARIEFAGANRTTHKFLNRLERLTHIKENPALPSRA